MSAKVIYVLWTVMFGMEQGLSVHTSKSACQQEILIQKAAGIIDTSKMKCIAYELKTSQ